MKHALVVLFIVCGWLDTQAQYAVSIEPLDVPEAPALQSFAYARYGSYLLLVGGRTDGLHKRQPFAAFDPQFDNHHLWVVDLAARRTWKRAIEGLPPDLTEQLHSTNMAFAQLGDTLFLAGGYGYSAQAETHVTYPFLTVMAVPNVIDAIIAGYDPASFIRQVRDERLAVAGGRMGWLGDRLFVAGGHRFVGPYNPMGADHGPGFTQTYTDEIRHFRVVQENDGLTIRGFQAWHDALQLHRRDYNLIPQIFPDRRPGYTMFAGVFQHNEDIPFLNCVDITASGYTVNESFSQYLSHYHTAVLPVYDANTNSMTTIFFGGISHFFVDLEGRLIRDMDVPFIRSVSSITRDVDGAMQERIFPFEMPALLGTGAEFILHPDAPATDHGILLVDETEDRVPAGYIVGGIRSSAPHVFWENGDSLSTTNATIYAVYLQREATTNEAIDGGNPLEIRLENQTESTLTARVAVHVGGTAYFMFQDRKGRIVHTESAMLPEPGMYDVELSARKLEPGPYTLQMSAGGMIRSIIVDLKDR